MNDERQLPAWLTALRTMMLTLAGIGDLAWEFGVDHLQHWPPTFVLAFWLLGGPFESLIQLITSGRIQVSLRKGEKDDSEP